MDDNARLKKADVLEVVAEVCSKELQLSMDETETIISTVGGMPVEDYGPVTLSIVREELLHLAGNLAWVRGYLAGAKVNAPLGVIQSLDALDRLAGREHFR
jgi:hypothetical protein